MRSEEGHRGPEQVAAISISLTLVARSFVAASADWTAIAGHATFIGRSEALSEHWSDHDRCMRRRARVGVGAIRHPHYGSRPIRTRARAPKGRGQRSGSSAQTTISGALLDLRGNPPPRFVNLFRSGARGGIEPPTLRFSVAISTFSWFCPTWLYLKMKGYLTSSFARDFLYSVLRLQRGCNRVVRVWV
jgi:hypothetical protein